MMDVGSETRESRVSLNDCMGSEEKICSMARISYGRYGAPEDARPLIEKLIKNRHLVPLEHCAITYLIECPVYVARQLARYRTAIISERSLRYSKPLETTPGTSEAGRVIAESYAEAEAYYQQLISMGVAKEEARRVLPLGTLTQMYYTINLRNLLHLLEQRLDMHAQRETREVARLMRVIAKHKFPTVIEMADTYIFPNDDLELLNKNLGGAR